MRIASRSASQDPAAFCRSFCELPGRVRRDPYRVALQLPTLTQQLIDWPSAGTAEFFLAYSKHDDVVGRVGVNLSPVHQGVAYAGFFEVDVASDLAIEVATRLLDEAGDWARKRGCKRLLGPVDLSTWFSYRFAVFRGASALAPRLFSWEPVNPSQYPQYFSRSGMSEIQEYHSLGFDAATRDGFLPGYTGAKHAYQVARMNDFSVRPLDLERLDNHELPLLHELTHLAFNGAYLFEPLAYSVFASSYARALRGFDVSPSRIAEAPGGRPAGFVIAFFDGEHVVIKTVAVLPEFQGMKLSSALLCPVLEAARERHIYRGVSALVTSGAKSEHHERRSERDAGGVSWRHTYMLFGKNL